MFGIGPAEFVIVMALLSGCLPSFILIVAIAVAVYLQLKQPPEAK